MSYATSRFANRSINHGTLSDLEGLMFDLEKIFPYHELLSRGNDILQDTDGEFDADDAQNLIDTISEIILINCYKNETSMSKVTIQAQIGTSDDRKWEIIPAETLTVFGEVKYATIAKFYMMVHPRVTKVRLEKNGCGQGHYFYRSDVIGK